MNSISGVNRTSLELAVTPDRLRGRVRGSRAVIGAAAVAIGSAAGGFLGERTGCRRRCSWRRGAARWHSSGCGSRRSGGCGRCLRIHPAVDNRRRRDYRVGDAADRLREKGGTRHDEDEPERHQHATSPEPFRVAPLLSGAQPGGRSDEGGLSDSQNGALAVPRGFSSSGASPRDRSKRSTRPRWQASARWC